MCVCGKIDPPTHDGYEYFVTFTDDNTHMTSVHLMKKKSEILQHFKAYHAMATSHFNRPMARVRCDNVGEYMSKEFKRFCAEKGIVIEYTTPYTPQLNGVSERLNRTLCERAKAMVAEAKLDRSFWGEALLTANFITNRSPTVALDRKTPYEVWFGKKPDVSALRVFGCKAYALVPSEKRKKLDDTGTLCYMIGYALNGCRLWNLKTKKVICSRHVRFDESTDVNATMDEPRLAQSNEPINLTTVFTPTRAVPTTPLTSTPRSTPLPSPITQLTPDTDAEGDMSYESALDETLTNHTTSPKPTTPVTTRYGRVIRRPIRLNDYIVGSHRSQPHTSLSVVDEVPMNYPDIFGWPDEMKWLQAVDDELQSHKENESWIPRTKSSYSTHAGSFR